MNNSFLSPSGSSPNISYSSNLSKQQAVLKGLNCNLTNILEYCFKSFDISNGRLFVALLFLLY